MMDVINYYKAPYDDANYVNHKIVSRVQRNDDMIRIFRQEVRSYNKFNKFVGNPCRYYIKLQGRGSRTSDAVHKWYDDKYDGMAPTHAFRRARCSLPLDLADSVDVYIYKR